MNSSPFPSFITPYSPTYSNGFATVSVLPSDTRTGRRRTVQHAPVALVSSLVLPIAENV